MKPIYLDTAAATPLDPRVAKMMSKFQVERWENPSSLHTGGAAVGAAVAEARQELAQLIGALPDEIVFTSGGTESNNLAVRGAPAGEIMVSAIEHASVLAPAVTRGEVVVLPVDETGLINLNQFKLLLNKNTSLVSIIYAHNEIGTIQPVKELAKIIRHHRARFNTPLPYFHLDACQAPRFLNLNVRQLGIDLMTLNAGKIYGPKGVGALFVRRGVKLTPLILGGGQESGRRSGTENGPGIIGFTTALKLATMARVKESKKLSALRDYVSRRVLSEIADVSLNGQSRERLPNNLNFSFAGVLGEQVVIELSAVGIAASTGSACSSPKHDSAYVILALGKNLDQARGAVRFTFGRETSKKDLDYLIKHLKIIITKLRLANYVYAADLAL